MNYSPLPQAVGPMPRLVRISELRAQKWTTAAFVAAGMRKDDASLVSNSLVHADCRGVFSHGLMRVRAYTKRLLSGSTDALATPKVVEKSGASVVIDGHNAMGQVVAELAVDRAVAQAHMHGVGIAAVRGSNHFGTCEYYAMKVSAQKMIGFVATVSAHNSMAPFGGAEAMLGNNPLAIAIPTLDAPPLVLDMAMSVAAGGKIRLASETGDPIPEEWAFDAAGNPTRNAQAALEGTFRPMAGYKGYGLSLMVAILAALLPGAAFGRDVGDMYREFTHAGDVGHFFQAIDIGRFGDRELFLQRVDAAIDLMHSAKKAAGVGQILVPGEREHLISVEQQAHGIRYQQAIVDDLNAVAGELGIAGLT
jgi:LDH2 family malate/lactate/ureidoglycolate dehydrogenase